MEATKGENTLQWQTAQCRPIIFLNPPQKFRKAGLVLGGFC